MNLTHSCPICLSLDCNCNQSILTFFNLLEAAEARKVLRVVNTSSSICNRFSCAGVDKLDGYFTQWIPVESIKTNLSSATTKKVHLKDRKPYLETKIDSGAFHLRLTPDNSHITGFKSNPNKFKTWETYVRDINTIVGPAALACSQISRVDLNLDFNCSLQDLIRSINLKNKRTSLNYIDKNGLRTGMYAGKGSETILIYDKTNPATGISLSRIEIKLLKEKLPTRSIYEISNKLTELPYFNNIDGINLSFLESKSELLNDRRKSFIMLLEREGFFSARRNFNLNNNFDRDFKNIININPWCNQPSELFKSGIQTFFQKEK